MAKSKKIFEENIVEKSQEENIEKEISTSFQNEEKIFQVGNKVKNVKNGNIYILCSFPIEVFDHSKIIVSSLENNETKLVFFKRDLELI
jgi:hypothetical protein